VSEPLAERVRSPGFTPRLRDAEELFGLFASADDELARDLERALHRLGPPGVEGALRRFEASSPPLRARLCALVGRFAASERGTLVDWLVERLGDSDPKTRRRAIRALGKIAEQRVEQGLVDAFEPATPLPDARAFAQALGNVGGEAALARLERIETSDPELARLVGEARMKIERSVRRRSPGSIDGTRSPDEPTPVLLHVRAGFEEILGDELGGVQSRIVGRGRVQVMLEGPLERLFRCRTFLHLGFPLPPERVSAGDVADAAVRALSSTAAAHVFQRFTDGPIRYRIDWSSGRRRGATFRVAAGVAALRPAFVNDPTDAVWEAVITDRSDTDQRLYVELWPSGLADPRFAYRRRTLPASSHPTVAAALARVGAAVPTDVVWDPFVGSGMELAERALLGPYAKLYGSDLAPDAIAAARENLTAAGARSFELFVGDARTVRLPEPPTLVITNPPFGKRVLDSGAVRPLLETTIDRVARSLRPGGRFVWMSPLPDFTAEVARQRRLSLQLRRLVDLGGVRAELQAFRASERR
jgi:hypothetical protein